MTILWDYQSKSMEKDINYMEIFITYHAYFRLL